jgi:uncharacterized membrane protein YgcG
MKSMEINKGEQPADAAHRISKALHAKWGVGLAACDNGILFLLAVDDRQVYISTGVGAQKSLSDNSLVDIISSMKPKLRAHDYDQAVEQAIVDLGLGLAGRPHSKEEWEWFPILFFGIIGFFMLRSIYKTFTERRQYRDCRTALEKVKQEQDKLRTKEWSKHRSCPVCLEEFSVNLETVDAIKPADGTAAEAAAGEPSAPMMPGTSSIDLDLSEDPTAPLLPNEDGGEASTSKGVSSGGLRRRNSGKSEDFLAGGSGGGASGSGSAEHSHKHSHHGGGSDSAKVPITLRCGHTFCESCLETWMEKAPTCPICRERVDKGDGGDGAGVGSQNSNQQSGASGGMRGRERNLMDDMLTAELMFRLMRLQTRYPAYITPTVMETWQTEAQSTGTFDWASAREFQLNDPAVRAHQEMRGSHGNTMSWGGGGGGGGGGAGGSW